MMPTDTRTLRILIANFVLRLASSAAGIFSALCLARINASVRPVSALEVSLVVAISYTAVELPLSPLAGAWSDRYGSRLMMIGGPLVAGAGVLILAMTTATPLLVLGRLLTGAGAALTTPSMLKQLAAYTEDAPATRSRVISLYQLGGLLGIVLGSATGGLVFGPLGVSAFILLAVVYALATPLLWSGALYHGERSTAAATEHDWRAYLRLFRLPSLRDFVPAWLLYNIVIGLWLSQIAYQLAGPVWPGQRLAGHFSDSQVGLLYGGYGGTILVGLLLWFWVLPRMRRSDAMFVAVAGMVGASAGVLLLNRLENWLIWPVLVLLAVSVMAEAGFSPASLALLGDISDEVETKRGALMGIYNVLLGGGQLIGGWIGGLAAGWAAIDGLSYATVLLAAVTAAFILPLGRMERRFQRRKTTNTIR